jgi:hypothetical protein
LVVVALELIVEFEVLFPEVVLFDEVVFAFVELVCYVALFA